jgi:hypothetical protein
MSRDGSEHRLKDGRRMRRSRGHKLRKGITKRETNLRPRPRGSLCSNFEFLHSVSNSFRASRFEIGPEPEWRSRCRRRRNLREDAPIRIRSGLHRNGRDSVLLQSAHLQ